MWIKNRVIYLLEIWAKIKSQWTKIPRWIRVIIAGSLIGLGWWVEFPESIQIAIAGSFIGLECWAKLPKWMQIVIGLAIFILAIYFLPVFHSSKKEIVDSRIHEEAFEFNKNKQVKQCRMKHCYKDMENCSKNDKYKKCVEQRIKRMKENFEK